MTFSDALENQLARLRTRYARTPLPGFFRWWGRELVALLPQRWRALLAERSEALLFEIRDGAMIVWRQSGQACVEAANVALDAPDAERAAALERVRAQIDDPNLRSFYCIAAARALRREFTLPVAAENNLRQVLAFEMDRQTPFKADQVYFDYRLGEREAAARNLQVELIVVPRAPLDADLAKLAAGSLELDGVDCWREGPGSGRLGLNLLPADRRPRRVNARLRLNLGLAAAAIVLLFTAMLLSLGNREAALAAMSEQVEKAQNAAKQVGALRKTLQDSISAANFLNRRKHEMPTMVQMLVNLIDFNLNIAEAAERPRVYQSGADGPLQLEESIPEDLVAGLKAKGHKVERSQIIGSTQSIMIGPDGVFYGAADTRRPDAEAAPVR